VISVTYEQNGGEYYGTIEIICDNWVKLDNKTLKVDGVRITLDECIVAIREIKDSQT
jgi:hypothetical protein